jgi:predicted phosphodiesterase
VRIFAIFSFVFVVSCAGTTSEWREPTPHALLTGPYVMLTGPSQALIGFRSTGEEVATVEWTSEGGRGSQTAQRDDDLYWVVFDNLPRGPVIDYTVKLDGKPAGSGSFRVGLAPGETKFRFAVFGDTRTNHQVHRVVIERVSKETIDFFLHTGDMVERGGKPEQWITYFQIERPLMQKAPILPSIGNHDLGNRGYYIKYFFLDKWTNGENYFVTDWGNVRLIAIDVTIVCESRCRQYRVVKAALEQAVAQNKLVVMFLHNPPYSSGSHGSDMQLRGVVGSLAKQYGVELVVTGHDHNYERTKPQDGTTYIVSGSAGAPIRPVNPQSFTAAARTEPHYVLVDVDGDKMSIRAVNLRGEVFDSAAIQPNPPGGPPTKAP